jgi:hypothetical protein
MKRLSIVAAFSRAADSVVRSIKMLLSGIGRLFIRKHNPAPPVQPQVQANPGRGESVYEEYADAVFGQDNEIINLGVHKRVSATHKYMYEIGRRDGIHGVQLANLADLAQAKAQEMFRHIYVTLKGSLASALARQKTQAAIMNSDKQCYEREEAYYNYVKYQYRYFPRYYSWKLGLMYLLIALALVLADIPLALTLIRHGFNLPGTELTDLFQGNFWDKIADNWETVTTAMGIALCTVYIKIFYDDFIGTPYAGKAMTFRKFIEENDMGIPQPANEELFAKIKKEDRFKKWWKIGLVLFTLAVIIILGLFRQETSVASARQAAALQQGTPLNPADIFELTFLGRLAFVGVTILFPVIGGICLSHSLTNFQNMRRLAKAQTSYESSRNKYLYSVEQFSIIEKQFEDLDAADKRFNEEEKIIEEYRAYLVSFYRRGYAIGAMQPGDTGGDFFSRVMEWRNTAIGRKINTHINKLNQS